MLGEIAAEAGRRFGDRPAFVGASGTLSYAEVDRRSDECAAGLLSRGVGPGDVVGLLLDTDIDYPVGYLATAKVGAIAAGINTRLPTAVQHQLVSLVGARLLLTNRAEAMAGLEIPTSVSTVADLRRGGQHPPPLTSDPDRPVAIVFTSGTTGTPKGAVFAERQLDAIRLIDVGTTWGAGGATLLGTSLAHLGFMTKLPGTLQAGRTCHLLARWRADVALRMTAELHLTSVSGVPTQVALMLAAPGCGQLDLSSVRLVLIGGGPATPALVRAARERFTAPVCTRYSCTEAGIGCGTHPGDPEEDAEQTVGRPQPGVELAIRSSAHLTAGRLPVGEVGEVLLRSAAAMSGYWRDPVATAAAVTTDGFVRTGDLGFLDEQGRLHLSGRTTERYVRGGYNVHPVAVERVLAAHPLVRDVVVVARADEVMGEIGVAVVVPEGRAPTLVELREFAATHLAGHELPEQLVTVDALPLTAGDKVDRAALARRVAELS